MTTIHSEIMQTFMVRITFREHLTKVKLLSHSLGKTAAFYILFEAKNLQDIPIFCNVEVKVGHMSIDELFYVQQHSSVIVFFII